MFYSFLTHDKPLMHKYNKLHYRVIDFENLHFKLIFDLISDCSTYTIFFQVSEKKWIQELVGD